MLFFSLPVEGYSRKVLGEMEKKQSIFEAETLAAVVAFTLWKERFSNKRCIMFLDNEVQSFPFSKALLRIALSMRLQVSMRNRRPMYTPSPC